MKLGRLFLFAGPSGGGKRTILRLVLAELCSALRRLVTYTSRNRRVGEENGVDYHFVPALYFESLAGRDFFLETNDFVDQMYGTPRDELICLLEHGQDVIIELDVNGIFAARDHPEIVNRKVEVYTIFLSPPSLQTLRRWLEGRSTETEEQVEKRIARAQFEVRRAHEFDICVFNEEGMQQKVADQLVWYVKHPFHKEQSPDHRAAV